MTRRRRHLRARALLLLAVFLGAGTSLPSLDALVYHTAGPDVRGATVHLEPAGPCPNHAAHCELGRTAAGSSAVGVHPAVLRLEAPVHSRREPAPALPLRTAVLRILGLPRAPPAHPA